MVSLSKLRSWCENSKCPLWVSKGSNLIPDYQEAHRRGHVVICQIVIRPGNGHLSFPCRSTATLAAKNRQDGVYDRPKLSKTDKLQ